MNKYYTGQYGTYGELERMMLPDESVIWKGNPKKSAFVINSSMKMAPFALIWLLFDGFFIVSFVGTGAVRHMLFFIVPFFALHLMPVWIWLFNTLTAAKRWKNTEYAVTNKRVLIRNGLVGYQYESIYYTDIANVSLHVGAVDKMLGVGDIYLLTNISTMNGKNTSPVIMDIENPQQVYNMVQSTVMNIQADIHYPNAYRPENNPGYHTKYNSQYDFNNDSQYRQ